MHFGIGRLVNQDGQWNPNYDKHELYGVCVPKLQCMVRCDIYLHMNRNAWQVCRPYNECYVWYLATAWISLMATCLFYLTFVQWSTENCQELEIFLFGQAIHYCISSSGFLWWEIGFPWGRYALKRKTKPRFSLVIRGNIHVITQYIFKYFKTFVVHKISAQ